MINVCPILADFDEDHGVHTGEWLEIYFVKKRRSSILAWPTSEAIALN